MSEFPFFKEEIPGRDIQKTNQLNFNEIHSCNKTEDDSDIR